MKTKIIPPGVYTIHNESAYRLQEEVMTGVYGDNPHLAMFTHKMPYETGWDFEGEEDLVIEAYGATLLVDGFMTAIALQHCRNITIKGLTIDLKRRAYSQGTVVQVQDGSFDVQFPPEKWLSETMPCPRMLFTDPLTGHISHVLNAALESRVLKTKIGDNTYRFPYSIPKSLLGHTVGVMHTWHGCPSILIYEAENITLQDVTIYSHPGMGIVGHRAHDVYLYGVKVVPADGMTVSTNTDATHFVSCSGDLVYDHCEFAGQGDDGANIHSFYQTILEKTGEATYKMAVLVRTDIHSLRMEYPLPGDTLEYSRKADLVPEGNYRVLESIPDYDTRQCTVTLERPLPEDCLGNVLTPINRLPALQFKDCYVHDHIARGILCRTSNSIIENNRFSYCTLEGICVAAEVLWNESSRSENVCIRNNTCENCGFTITMEASSPAEPIHKNITLEHNCIQGDVRIGYVSGLTLCKNRIDGKKEIINCNKIKEI